MSIIVKANRFYIDLVYVLIDIRRFVFLTVVLLLFSACQSVRDSGAADNSNGISTNTPKNSPTVSYALEFIVDGFQKPIYVTHAGDGTGRLFVVEQSGVIWIVMDGQVFNEPFLDLSNKITRRSSEQGLLGLAFDPNYSNNGQFFVHYSDNNGDTVVMKLFVSGNANRANHQSGIKVLTQSQPYRNHNGGQIAFGPDGNLYVGLGDGGLAGDPHNNGQNLQTWLGSILRVSIESPVGYTVPSDNPFVDNQDARSEIWVYGLRNPWRFSFDRITGDLYIADVGQNNWEEINFQSADSLGGENYGWSNMEGNHCYRLGCDSGLFSAPIVDYHHSNGECSVTGGYVYRGEALLHMSGSYVYGDFCSGTIWTISRITPDDWDEALIIESDLQISSFGEDEDGELYVVDYAGGIYKIVEDISFK
ncbi:MAG: glucose dehydrogenase [Chloroflexi bacterium]|nr:glucose dehydrogenase [Chloroflexota bacterium]